MQRVPKVDALAGLLHDAAEAYVGDMVSPLKRRLADFQVVENDVEAAVFERFNLPPILPESVKRADLEILAAEAERVLVKAPEDWGLPYPPAKVDIDPWDWQRAERYFLHLFDLAVGGKL
jgi:hypothetical protein